MEHAISFLTHSRSDTARLQAGQKATGGRGYTISRRMDLTGTADGIAFRAAVVEMSPRVEFKDRMKVVIGIRDFKAPGAGITLSEIAQVFAHMRWAFPSRPHRALNRLLQEGLVEEESTDVFRATDLLRQEVNSRFGKRRAA